MAGSLSSDSYCWNEVFQAISSQVVPNFQISRSVTKMQVPWGDPQCYGYRFNPRYNCDMTKGEIRWNGPQYYGYSWKTRYHCDMTKYRSYLV